MTDEKLVENEAFEEAESEEITAEEAIQFEQYLPFNGEEAAEIIEPVEENAKKNSSSGAVLSKNIANLLRYLKSSKTGLDFNELLNKTLLHIPETIEHIGAVTVSILVFIFKKISPLFVKPALFIFSLLKTTFLNIKDTVSSMPKTFSEEAGKMKFEMKLIRKRASKTKSDRFLYLKAMRKYLVISFSKHTVFWKTVLNTAFPIIMIIAVAALFNSSKNKVTALEVLYNGSNIGFVENETIFENGKALAAELVPVKNLSAEYSEALNSKPVYRLTRVSPAELSSDKMICESIIEGTDATLVHACGIYIDGEFLCAVRNESDAVSVFESLLAPSKKNASKNTIVAFVEEISYNQGLYPTELIWDSLKLKSTLKEPKSKAKYYKIKAGDTAKSIAKSNSVSVSELKALNPKVDFSELKEGKKLLISAESSFVRIKVMKTRTQTTVLKYETERRESSSILKGTTKVMQNGKNGKKVITELVTYINGKETYSATVSEKITASPVKEVIYVGTKTVSSYTPSTHHYSGSSSGGSYSGGSYSSGSYSGGSSAKFIWPARGASVLSSTYGYRSASISGWSYHGGVDIIKSGGHSTGCPVVAAASGTVVTAVSGYSGYGHTVVIDHGNGLRTRYAHMQPGSITVRAGQRVYQGQQIGRIGSTGNVTGPHLHFEVLKNGSKVNPLPYIR